MHNVGKGGLFFRPSSKRKIIRAKCVSFLALRASVYPMVATTSEMVFYAL